MPNLRMLLPAGLLVCSACAAPARSTGPSGVRPAPLAVEAAATPAPPAPQASVAPDPLYLFEGVEVFGIRKLPREELLRLIGMPAPGSRFNLEAGEFTPHLVESKPRLLAAHPLPFCRYSMVTYPPTRTFRVTVDLVEPGNEWRMRFAPAPTGSVEDPGGLIAAWGAYQQTYWTLRREGAVSETSVGGCRALTCYGGFDHPQLAPLEATFLEGVPRHTDALVRVLREDRDDSKRMTAAILLSYVRSREALVRYLIPAVHDPFEGVRNEALRLLGTAQEGQPKGLLPLEPVLEALWFPLSSDRNKAAWALVRVVEAEGATRRTQILNQAGEVLVEMAGMRQAVDREPARKVLTLLAGRDLGEDVAAWREWVARTRTAPAGH
ncbi:HEAT repeat domain-containing protein [Corallococcus sp. BB11-1]|uniref:HEAT repeat domain-containing protein n=1 Tax=Corallococcus sp. BB11-1 TaxID=2996783 RepID=UPI00227086FA|nr:HEAT repeat domain-containing protein [Corallococcus sp. BB11-1]MCY1033722.1 HEAT repeat domain-containing protein [Corallococcus sp. BB11-1]